MTIRRVERRGGVLPKRLMRPSLRPMALLPRYHLDATSEDLPARVQTASDLTTRVLVFAMNLSAAPIWFLSGNQERTDHPPSTREPCRPNGRLVTLGISKVPVSPDCHALCVGVWRLPFSRRGLSNKSPRRGAVSFFGS